MVAAAPGAVPEAVEAEAGERLPYTAGVLSSLRYVI